MTLGSRYLGLGWGQGVSFFQLFLECVELGSEYTMAIDLVCLGLGLAVSFFELGLILAEIARLMSR